LLELERGFKERLKHVIGARSVLSFAKECGFSDSLLRKYLVGTIPGLDKALIISEVGGVSLDWLTTGRMPVDAAESSERPGLPAEAYNRLPEVVEEVEEAKIRLGITLSPRATGRIIRMLLERDLLSDNVLPEKVVEAVILGATTQEGSVDD